MEELRLYPAERELTPPSGRAHRVWRRTPVAAVRRMMEAAATVRRHAASPLQGNHDV